MAFSQAFALLHTFLNKISTPSARLPRPYVWEVKRETATSCCLLENAKCLFSAVYCTQMGINPISRHGSVVFVAFVGSEY